MSVSTLVTLFTTLGIGSLIGIFIQSKLDKQKHIISRLNELNEEKYRSILIYMSLTLNPDNLSHFIMKDEILMNLKTDNIPTYSIDKLKEYYYHSILYASDEVLKSIRSFIETPTRDNYTKSALAMRRHLWGKETAIKDIEDVQ